MNRPSVEIVHDSVEHLHYRKNRTIRFQNKRSLFKAMGVKITYIGNNTFVFIIIRYKYNSIG